MNEAGGSWFLCKMRQFITKSILIATLSFIQALTADAQKMISVDLASVRNIRHRLNGLNVSAFYHITENLTAGIEMNRFFLSGKKKEIA